MPLLTPASRAMRATAGAASTSEAAGFSQQTCSHARFARRRSPTRIDVALASKNTASSPEGAASRSVVQRSSPCSAARRGMRSAPRSAGRAPRARRRAGHPTRVVNREYRADQLMVHAHEPRDAVHDDAKAPDAQGPRDPVGSLAPVVRRSLLPRLDRTRPSDRLVAVGGGRARWQSRWGHRRAAGGPSSPRLRGPHGGGVGQVGVEDHARGVVVGQGKRHGAAIEAQGSTPARRVRSTACAGAPHAGGPRAASASRARRRIVRGGVAPARSGFSEAPGIRGGPGSAQVKRTSRSAVRVGRRRSSSGVRSAERMRAWVASSTAIPFALAPEKLRGRELGRRDPWGARSRAVGAPAWGRDPWRGEGAVTSTVRRDGGARGHRRIALRVAWPPVRGRRADGRAGGRRPPWDRPAWSARRGGGASVGPARARSRPGVGIPAGYGRGWASRARPHRLAQPRAAIVPASRDRAERGRRASVAWPCRAAAPHRPAGGKRRGRPPCAGRGRPWRRRGGSGPRSRAARWRP